jgi:hypothetical protein
MAHICEVKAEYKISVEKKSEEKIRLEDLVIDGGKYKPGFKER